MQDVGYDEMQLSEQNGPGRLDDDYHRWLAAEGRHDLVDLLDQEQEYRAAAPPAYWESVGALESNLDEAHHSTTWIADKAVAALRDWASAEDGGGELLHVSFIKPHHPFDPPARTCHDAMIAVTRGAETHPERHCAGARLRKFCVAPFLLSLK